MTHIMVDLETLSTRYNAAIVAIGAVKFSAEKKCYDKFYQAVNVTPPQDCFHVSSDTLSWWQGQSAQARAVFTDPTAVDIGEALKSFYHWAIKDTADINVRMWGNGASFDNVILGTSYDLCNLPRPWKFFNDRCYRTIKNLNPTVGITRMGVHHNALNDAETQAIHLLAMEIPLA